MVQMMHGMVLAWQLLHVTVISLMCTRCTTGVLQIGVLALGAGVSLVATAACEGLAKVNDDDILVSAASISYGQTRQS